MSASPRRAELRTLERRAARRASSEPVVVTVADGPFAGWSATVRTDFPASTLALLEGETIVGILEALDAIVIEHNYPNAKTGELAESIAEVDWRALKVVAPLIMKAIADVPFE